MRILVTGGAGFLGTHLVTRLLNDGQRVRILEHPDADVTHLPQDDVEIVRVDIRDRAGVDAAVHGCTSIYHLAADPNLWRRKRREFDQVNHLGTVNVLQSGIDHGVERMLHTSTESILTTEGDRSGAVETLKLRESDMLGPYCLSKYHAECAAFDMAAKGAPIIVVAPTLPVGPGDRRQTPPTRMAVALCRGQLPAIVDCQFNLIDARDVAAGMVAAMARGRPHVRYLLGGNNYWLSEWLGLLAKSASVKPPRWQVPYALAVAVAWCSERWADLVTGKNPLATVTGVRLTRRSMYFDPSKSLTELDITPRPIESSAHDAVQWYRAEGWID